MTMKDRIESEQTMQRITNQDMVCKDCLLALDDTVIFGNSSRCELYQDCKPYQVLLGGKCDEYIQK